MKSKIIRFVLLLALLVPTACAAAPTPAPTPGLRVLAVESFLADIAQNVAGSRLAIDALIPLGVDPHAFETTPADVARIAQAQVVILNGAGFEEWLDETLQNAGGQRQLIIASDGLTSRAPKPGEMDPSAASAHPIDPHFWMNPQLTMRYVENIRAGLTLADPDGAEFYTRSAAAYLEKLAALDSAISAQLAAIPPQRRLLATNHESLGYFADRYDLRIIGTIIPSVSTSASPSAAQLAALIDQLRRTQAPALFLEIGANSQLAEQVAAETGVRIISDIYTHSLSAPSGPAPTYIAMMEHNAALIAQALQP